MVGKNSGDRPIPEAPAPDPATAPNALSTPPPKSEEPPRSRHLLDDEAIASYWRHFNDRETQSRIKARAAQLIRQLDQRHHCGAADFKHEVKDLIHQAWSIQLGRREVHATRDAFADAFCATMSNYCRNRRRRSAGRTFLDTTDAKMEAGRSATIVPFAAPDRAAEDRDELVALMREIDARAPHLKPLFLAFADDVIVAREQAAYLNLPVEQIYQLRKQLKAFARQALER